jgi:hypothetical protein
MARLSAFTSSEANEPTSLPKRLLGTAVKLSTIIRHGARSPRLGTGLDGKPEDRCLRWISGQGAHEIESFASNRSSWTMTAGRGLPAQAAPPATVQISPRFILHSRRKLRRRTTGPAWREDSSPPPATGGVRPGRRTSTGRPEPRSERGEAPPSAVVCDARGPYRGMWIEQWLPCGTASGYM